MHHGSSISHGSNAVRPTGTWPAVAARLGGVDLVNLGFGGGAVLDPFVARTMRDTPADLLSLKVGINIVGGDLMRRRVLGPAVHGFLDTLREGHPSTPLLVVTPVLCPIHEDTPGPGVDRPRRPRRGAARLHRHRRPGRGRRPELTLAHRPRGARSRRRAAPGRRTRTSTSSTASGSTARTTPRTLPLPDALHPDEETHQLMGERFARTVFGAAGGLFPTSWLAARVPDWPQACTTGSAPEADAGRSTSPRRRRAAVGP